MINVLIVMPLSTLDFGSRSSGGVDSACQILLDSLIQKNNLKFNYTIIAFNPFNDFEEEGKCSTLTKNIKIYQYNNKPNLKHRLIRPPGIVWQNYVIWKLVRKSKPKVFHTHLLSWQILPKKQTTTITTLHAYKKIGRSPVSKLNDLFYETIIPAISNKNINYYTAVSHRLKNLALDSNKNISVIYNPLPDKYSETDIRLEEKSKTDRINLVTCGNITKNKGIHHAIEILYKLHKKGISSHLNIIGGTTNNSYHAELREQISKLNLKSNITFHGKQPFEQILKTYKESDYGLFLSAEETFGLVPIEMIACGLEVICSRVGIMDDLYNEFSELQVKIVETIDSSEIAEYIYRKGKCRLDEAKDYIIKNFSKEIISSEYEKLYESVLISAK
ncbi:Glycosyltransferase Gtf1 [Pseudomonas fluorescens]|uniref:VpsD family glycosyltransferase n=1 Tax=Pseudomonas fluorescens TaxID=294 RepID=UPI001242715E|nr:VpsD family glycosyltransferase [Pseudomonas fluorescens]VVP88699.1 Glycosyltransferase Gtf1 [Pseudomonas fluorescens]